MRVFYGWHGVYPPFLVSFDFYRKKIIFNWYKRMFNNSNLMEKDRILKQNSVLPKNSKEELFNLAMSISKTCTKLNDKKLMELDVRMTKLPMLMKSKFNIP